MPTKTQTKPAKKAAARRRCQWCPKYLILVGGAYACRDCDLHGRWPSARSK